MRPNSIVRFEHVYWGIIALGIVNTALGWGDMMASVQVQRMVATIGPGSVYGTVVLGLLIQFALWFFIARRGSVVAKWLFVILSAFGMVTSVFALVGHGAASAPVGIVAVALLILQGIAIWLLFQPDTKPWFGESVPAA